MTFAVLLSMVLAIVMTHTPARESSCCAAAADELKNDRDQCQHEQNMDKPGRDMKRHETKQPQYEEHDGHYPK